MNCISDVGHLQLIAVRGEALLFHGQTVEVMAVPGANSLQFDEEGMGYLTWAEHDNGEPEWCWKLLQKHIVNNVDGDIFVVFPGQDKLPFADFLRPHRVGKVTWTQGRGAAEAIAWWS